MKQSRQRETNMASYLLFVELKKIELMETESRKVVAGSRGRGGNGERLFKGYNLSVNKMNKV